MDTNPVQIISPNYCLPNPIDLTIIRKVFNTKEDFHIVDANDNLMFKVTSKYWSFSGKKVLVDAAGNPIINLKPKASSLHSRWQAFRGERSKPQDLIFSAKKSSLFQWKRKLNVYLANNTSEDVCDYKVKGSWNEKSCTIYVGESTNVVAQMRKKNSFLGKDKFMVTVNPNVDYAFIMAIIVILDAINSQAAAAAASSKAAAAAAASSNAAAGAAVATS